MRDADDRPNGVTQAAIDAAPASVSSLRFLDEQQTEPACQRAGDDQPVLHVQRGRRRPLRARRAAAHGVRARREIDYSARRTSSAATSATRTATASSRPVNEIDAAGRPRFIADGIPQEDLPTRATRDLLRHARPPALGARQHGSAAVPGRPHRAGHLNGKTGLKGVGLRRLALTLFLGRHAHLRRRPALLEQRRRRRRAVAGAALPRHRARAQSSRPSCASTTTRTSRQRRAHPRRPQRLRDERPLPVLRDLPGRELQRGPAIMDMDAYTGETRFYVLDPEEPITRPTAGLPRAFTPMRRCPSPCASTCATARACSSTSRRCSSVPRDRRRQLLQPTTPGQDRGARRAGPRACA